MSLALGFLVPGEAVLADLFCPEATQLEPSAPFASIIRPQCEKRRGHFADPAILPESDFCTFAAVQTSVGLDAAFSSWFEAHVKRRGSSAMQIRGALQIMFRSKSAMGRHAEGEQPLRRASGQAPGRGKSP